MPRFASLSDVIAGLVPRKPAFLRMARRLLLSSYADVRGHNSMGESLCQNNKKGSPSSNS
jgi:hypothetical protein